MSTDLQQLKNRLDHLHNEAQRREDYLAIIKLQRAYGFYLDKGYWREATDLFTEDATFEEGVDGVYIGRERIHQVIVKLTGGNSGPGLPFGQLNERFQLQAVITISDDGSTAQGRWHELSMLGQFGEHAEWGEGVYENHYRKEDGVWKIAVLRFFPNFVAPYEGGWSSLKPVEGDWRSNALHDFPSDNPPTVNYKPFPDIYVPPFHYQHPVTQNSATDNGWKDTGEASSDPLTVQIGNLELRLARVASHEAIERLQRSYSYYIDKGLWSDASALFSSEGVWEWGQSGVYEGPDRIKAALQLRGPEGLAPGELNTHFTCQPIITISPDNLTAKARWRSDMQLCSEGKGLWGEGTYENCYVNEDGVWKISSLHFYVTVLCDYDLGWVVGDIPMEGPSDVLPPDQPPTEIYESLPGVYLPAYHYANPVTGAQPVKAVLPELSNEDAALVAEIATLSARVEKLEDQRACEKLQRAYGYYVDKSMWDDVADLFVEESTLEIGGRGVFLGKKRVLEYMGIGLGPTGPQREQIINHQQFQGIVSVSDDGESARGRWRAFVIGGSSWAPVNWGDCLYENHYKKVDGIWVMYKLHAPFTMYTLYSEGWHKSTTPNTRPESFPPPPDLAPTVVYLTYPNFYCEPYHYVNPVTGQKAPRPHPAAGGVAPMTDSTNTRD